MAIDLRLVDVTLPESGYPAHIAAQDTREAMKGAAEDAGAIVTEFPDHMWIEPRDWPAVAAENDANHTWPVDYMDRFTCQGSSGGIGEDSHECTTHCFTGCFEATWNLQRQIAVGPPVPKKRLEISAHSASVWISCLSLYIEANPGKRGGAGVRQILNIAARRGCLPDNIQPRDYGFKHTLIGTCGAGGVNQSRGNWIKLSQFPDGWEETAKHFKPLEYIFPDTWEQTVCLVLNKLAVGVGRAGHSVPYCRWMPNDNVMQYRDSYDIFRYDSISRIKATVGGSYAIASTTIPDDWDKPAG